MKSKFVMLAAAGALAIGGVIYGFTSKKETCPMMGTAECSLYENCPKKGQPDCPLIQNCPKKGQADCPYVNGEASCCSRDKH